MKSKLLIFSLLLCGFLFLIVVGCSNDDEDGTVTDIDGNVYHTVKIGSQVWMTENLRVTRFNDGSSIDIITGEKSANDWPDPRLCWYDNDLVNKDKYGVLYNYRVVNAPEALGVEIAPKGWHIPSDEEWKTLTDYLGGENIAGGKLKSMGTIEANTGLWHSPNIGATNESGFSALPGGLCSNLNSFSSYNLGYLGAWWSSTKTQKGHSSFSMFYKESSITHYNEGRDYNTEFMSIRCIKD